MAVTINQVPDNGGVYLVPAFSGLFAPYWRSDARGIIVGLTAFNTRAHIVRAALESTAFQTMEVLDAMARDASTRVSVLKVDGGMTQNSLLMQTQADLLHDIPLDLPSVTETTALGSAFAAGLAVGYWKDLDELKLTWRRKRRWTADMPLQHRNRQASDKQA